MIMRQWIRARLYYGEWVSFQAQHILYMRSVTPVSEDAEDATFIKFDSFSSGTTDTYCGHIVRFEYALQELCRNSGQSYCVVAPLVKHENDDEFVWDEVPEYTGLPSDKRLTTEEWLKKPYIEPKPYPVIRQKTMSRPKPSRVDNIIDTFRKRNA